MEDVALAFGAVSAIVVVVFGVLTLMIPVMIYTGQKYASKCFHELERLNGQVGQLVDEVHAQRVERIDAEEAEYRRSLAPDPDS